MPVNHHLAELGQCDYCRAIAHQLEVQRAARGSSIDTRQHRPIAIFSFTNKLVGGHDYEAWDSVSKSAFDHGVFDGLIVATYPRSLVCATD